MDASTARSKSENNPYGQGRSVILGIELLPLKGHSPVPPRGVGHAPTTLEITNRLKIKELKINLL